MFVAICSVGARVSPGQARITAQRESEVAPFGDAAFMRPLDGQSANLGYGAGVDVTPFMFRWLQPSLELRFTGDSGPIAHEYTYAGGIRAATTFRRIHPYATLLKGLGAIYFTHPALAYNGPYARDGGSMFCIGGGADVDVGHTWQVQLDYSQQHWALYLPPLRPDAFSVGVTYRIPFRNGRMKD